MEIKWVSQSHNKSLSYQLKHGKSLEIHRYNFAASLIEPKNGPIYSTVLGCPWKLVDNYLVSWFSSPI